MMADKVRKPGIGTLDKSAMDATGFDTKHINKFCGASHPDFSMSKKREFEIDEELKALFAPLSAEEFEILEKDILKIGQPRESLMLAKIGEGRISFLMDGHNRLAICEKHNLPYSLSHINFNSIDEAKAWMLQNQLGRRNVTDSSLYLGRLYELTKNSKGGKKGKGEEGRGKDTAKELAEKHNVSERTVRNSASLAKAVEKLNKFCPEFEIEKKLKHKGVTKRDAIEAAKFAEKDPAKARDIVYGTSGRPGQESTEMRPYADQMADEAITKLKKIPKIAPGRREALLRVSDWIIDNK